MDCAARAKEQYDYWNESERNAALSEVERVLKSQDMRERHIDGWRRKTRASDATDGEKVYAHLALMFASELGMVN